MKLWQKLGLPAPKSEASGGKISLKDNEIYSGIELPEMPFFVRLDGWSFHGLTYRIKLKRPFDKWFISALVASAESFFLPFNPCLAYIFSDEINLLFTKPTSFRRIEKIDSVFAGLASSVLTNQLRQKYRKALTAVFDCRCVPLEEKDINPYLIWRQVEAFRNSNNSWAQFLLMEKEKLSARAAAKRLEGMKTAQLRQIIEKYVGLKKIPAWHERGVLLYKIKVHRKGYNPITKQHVTVERREVKTDWQPPIFASKEGKAFIEKLIKENKE